MNSSGMSIDPRRGSVQVVTVVKLFDSWSKPPTMTGASMNDLLRVLRFGWPYFRKYWSRLSAGILLGVLFGLSNASFVWATKTLITRMSPEPAAPKVQRAEQQELSRQLKARIEQQTGAWVDSWLP